MPTDNDPKPTPSAEPFRRHAVWGRPPQTTFRAGPLPRGGQLAPLPKPPPAGPAVIATPSSAVPPQRPAQPVGTRPDIFSGSMIPRPAYKPMPALPTQTQTQPARPTPATPVVESSLADQTPDLTVRPLPSAAAVKPEEPAAAPPVEHQPVIAAPTPSTATVQVATEHSRGPNTPNRLPLFAGAAVAAVAVGAAGIWWINRAPDAPVTPVPEVVAPTVVTPVLAVPATETAPPPAVSPAVSDPAPATATPRPGANAATTTAPVRPVPSTASRPAPAVTTTPTPAPTVQTPAPVVIEIAPTQPASPPPTTAAPPTSDPNAPVVTRPQPLD